jgi:beta-lactamase class D
MKLSLPKFKYCMKFIIYSLLVFFLFACTANNVKNDSSLKKYFDEHNTIGCFALMDNGTGQFTVYNLSRYRDSAYLPASTFKIINSLIGLQTGKISSDSMIIKWDGVKRWVDEWNQDLTMYQAFRVSAVNYYQEVARRIGRDTMQAWLNKLGYGAKDKKEKVVLKSPVDSFWVDNSLKITPDQQLGIVKQLYFNQLPFHKIYQEKVKNAMLFESNTNYRLGYKTGWGFVENGNALGWIVGWIEENNHPYFFVLNLESADKNIDMVTVRMKILKHILAKLGFLKGNM